MVASPSSQNETTFNNAFLERLRSMAGGATRRYGWMCKQMADDVCQQAAIILLQQTKEGKAITDKMIKTSLSKVAQTLVRKQNRRRDVSLNDHAISAVESGVRLSTELEVRLRQSVARRVLACFSLKERLWLAASNVNHGKKRYREELAIEMTEIFSLSTKDIQGELDRWEQEDERAQQQGPRAWKQLLDKRRAKLCRLRHGEQVGQARRLLRELLPIEKA